MRHAPRLFGAHVLERSHKRAMALALKLIQRNTKIGYEHATRVRQQNVIGLQIPMHDTVTVRMVDRLGDLSDDARRLNWRKYFVRAYSRKLTPLTYSNT